MQDSPHNDVAPSNDTAASVQELSTERPAATDTLTDDLATVGVQGATDTQTDVQDHTQNVTVDSDQALTNGQKLIDDQGPTGDHGQIQEVTDQELIQSPTIVVQNAELVSTQESVEAVTEPAEFISDLNLPTVQEDIQPTDQVLQPSIVIGR